MRPKRPDLFDPCATNITQEINLFATFAVVKVGVYPEPQLVKISEKFSFSAHLQSMSSHSWYH